MWRSSQSLPTSPLAFSYDETESDSNTLLKCNGRGVDIGHGITIRALRNSENLNELKALHNDLFPVRYDDKFFNGLLSPETICIIAVSTGSNQIIGFASGKCKRNLNLPSVPYSLPFKNPGYLMTLGVKAQFQKRGLGKILVAVTTKLFRERFAADGIELDVLPSNEAAKRFYQKLGYKIFMTVPKFYIVNSVSYDSWRLYMPLSSSPVFSNDLDAREKRNSVSSHTQCDTARLVGNSKPVPKTSNLELPSQVNVAKKLVVPDGPKILYSPGQPEITPISSVAHSAKPICVYNQALFNNPIRKPLYNEDRDVQHNVLSNQSSQATLLNEYVNSLHPEPELMRSSAPPAIATSFPRQEPAIALQIAQTNSPVAPLSTAPTISNATWHPNKSLIESATQDLLSLVQNVKRAPIFFKISKEPASKVWNTIYDTVSPRKWINFTKEIEKHAMENSC